MLKLITILALAHAITFAANATPDSRVTAAPTAEQILPAMHRAFGERAAQIEIIEISHFPVPAGDAEFLLKDLNPPPSPDVPTRWRGSIVVANHRKFSIWATVQIKADCTRVVATEDLEVGRPIRESQVHQESYSGFPFGKDSFIVLSEIVGRVPLRSLHAGAVVRPDATVEPIVVAAGSDLVVELRSPRFRIKTMAIALSSGRIGERISVRNSSSKKIFEAKVLGPGLAALELAQ